MAFKAEWRQGLKILFVRFLGSLILEGSVYMSRESLGLSLCRIKGRVVF